jgi:PST family polysaccharide transporter
MSAGKNARWIALSQGARIVFQLVGVTVLARILPPSDYGLMAMAMVVVNFANLFRDMGTAAAVIQKKELTERTTSVVFWLNLGLGTCIGVALFAFSPLIAAGFKSASLSGILCSLSISFPILGSAAVHQALLERKSRFQTLTAIEVSSSFMGLLVAIGSAYLGAGVYSLVAQTLVTSGIAGIQLWMASGWRPTRQWKGREFKELLRFSGNLSAFNFINYLARNADSMIIGRYLGSAALGTYSVAYRFMLLPVQNMTFVASRALYPVMSRHQGDISELAAQYIRVVSFIAFIAAPMMVCLFVLRRPVVHVLFGTGWMAAADVLGWLLPVGFIQSIVSTGGTVFMARGRTDILMRLGMLGAVLQICSFWLGAKLGVVGVAECYCVANLLNSVPALYFTMRQLESSLTSLLKNISGPILSSVISGILVYFVRKFEFFDTLKPVWDVVLSAGLLCIIYGWLSFFADRGNLVRMGSMLMSVRFIFRRTASSLSG